MLSVVIPAFDREREIRRAIESCLAQEDADFEVIVVDDGSRDGTASVVAEYAGRGVRLLRHPANLGSSPARATGLAAARGDWIVRLDSDDELLPGALRKVQHCTSNASENVGRIGLMYRYVDGRVSPFPPPSGRPLDYEGFIAWLENSEMYDSLTVTRRSSLEEVPMPAGRLMEFLHHLDFARRFETVWMPEAGATYHVDAGRRLSRSAPTREEGRQTLEEVDAILERHGEALRRLAPRFHAAQRRRRVVALALLGERARAMSEARRQLKLDPLSMLQWAALVCVVLGERPLSLALRIKWWLVEERRKRMCRPRSLAPSSTS